MKFKTKNFLRNPKQSFLFFIIILILITSSLIYLFILNQRDNKLINQQSTFIPEEDILNDNNEPEQQPETQIQRPIQRKERRRDPSLHLNQSSNQQNMPMSTPIVKDKNMDRTNNQENMGNYPVKPRQQYIPLSANSSNPTQDVDPWQFISYLPTDNTRLSTHNREKTNDYFLEGIGITKVYSGSLNKNIEEPYETENFKGGDGFTYLH